MAFINKKLLKSLSIYTFANLLNASIPFFLLPILTNTLTPEDYGVISIFQLILSFSVPLTGLNAEGAVSREYFSDNVDKNYFSKYVSNAVLIVIIVSIIMLSLVVLSGSYIQQLTDFPSPWLWVVVVCAFSNNISEILLAVWQVKYKSIQYSIFKILKTLVEFGLTIFLILNINKSWESRVNGQMIASILFVLLAFFFLYKEKLLSLKLEKEKVKSILKFGIPLIPHVTGAVVITMIDRLFIAKMIGVSEAGLYAVGFQVAQLISLLQNSFNIAWVPWFYDKLNEKSANTNLKIVKFTYLYFCIMLAVAFAVSFSAPLIFKIFIGQEYTKAIDFVFWIALGFAFNGMYKMVVNYFFYIKETYWVSVITFVTAGINLVLIYYLVSINGAIGAAQSTAVAFFIQFILVWLLCSRKYKMPWLFFWKRKN